jgi:hypothetical protein
MKMYSDPYFRTLKAAIVPLLLIGLGTNTEAGDMSSHRDPLFNKVEHFYVQSARAKELYLFFSERVGLPQVWPFDDYGSFASGGLSLGNVAFEIVRFPDYSGPTRFQGVAFEPSGDADSTAIALTNLGVAHSTPVPYKQMVGGKEKTLWANVRLTELPPLGATLFICDYKERDRVWQGRAAASQKLAARNGGPLGVKQLREIIVAVKDLSDGRKAWAKLLGAHSEKEPGLFIVGPGPAIRLTENQAEGIQEIVIEVSSLASAKNFLSSQNLLGNLSNERVTIQATAVQGLMISLVER